MKFRLTKGASRGAMRWLALAPITAAVAACMLVAFPPTAVSAEPPAIAAKCCADLAKRLGANVGSIEVELTERVTWPSSALGLSQPGMAYTAAMTPGWRVVLIARNTRHLYTTSQNVFRYAGPLPLWADSLLYVRPIAHEPNLNGALMQSSLLGTGEVRLLTGASEIYPQNDGSILAVRRTSRSGSDLLYLAPGAVESAKTIHRSYGYGEAALSGATGQWAAFVRRGMGRGWEVAVGSITATAEPRYVTVPDDVRPLAIAWSDKDLFVRVRKGNMAPVYKLAPEGADPALVPTDVQRFPGALSLVLSKSDTLVVRQADATAAPTPTVDVVIVRFTGDRRTVAQIRGMEMTDFRFFGSRYVFVWGQQADQPTACTVDIRTGEVIPAGVTGARELRLLQRAPRVTPLSPSIRALGAAH